MRIPLTFMAALVAATPAHAAPCKLKPKDVATRFMTEFYINKQVRKAFETWVDPGYIQHNPMAATGRDAAIAFLEPFFAQNPGVNYAIKRIIADGNLVAVHAHGRFSAEDRGMAVVEQDVDPTGDASPLANARESHAYLASIGMAAGG